MARGVLHLVVGPSGVGKDTLIDAARVARPDLFFARRWITRAADAGGEDHRALDAAAFDAMAARGAFALAWRAHGLGYGIDREIEPALAAGRHVVANVSRAVVAEARARLAPVRVLAIEAAPEALAARLAARGREAGAAAADRLGRGAQGFDAGAAHVTRIDNGGPLAPAIAAFLAALAPPRSA